jgi:hypothetical protein
MSGWLSRLVFATALVVGVGLNGDGSAQEQSGKTDPSRTFSGTVEEIKAGSPGPVTVRIKPEVGPVVVLEALPQQMLDISQGDQITVQVDKAGKLQKVMKKMAIPEMPTTTGPEPVAAPEPPVPGTKDHP